ncbi:ComEC/Rec2 family competence protein [Bacteroides faecalis]|nr:ComEC/Rec2 family competence protein [Bacteroides faecalis]
MDNYYLHQYPYIRLIIPWITGVFCGDMFFDNTSVLSGSILLFCFFVGLSFAFHFLRRHSLRWCFGFSVSALCFMGGWIGITGQLQQSVYDFKDQETVYRVRLTDAPELKERSYLCRVFLEEYHDSVNICPVERKAILYLEQDSSVVRLQDGDELLVSSQISPPVNGKNFGEFDYSRYLMYKGIAGTGYVASGKWTKLSSVSVSSLRLMANSYREKLLALYRKLGFEGDELAVLSALTVGDKTELSESIRESYSVSGASHVLALSGLHIGLLYVLFSYILKLLDVKGGNAGKYLRTLLLLLLLWSFAFFTGLSPSVIRSASMFSALAVAEVFSRKAISLNTLAAVAWFMLLCKPVWLFDVGFQLSFLAVASILLIQKPIYQLLPVKGWLGKYIWGLMAVSIAAQLGTAPLVMFYFSRFSTHFLLTNLVVIPLVTIILYMAVLMLCLTPFFWLQSVMAEGCRLLLKALNTFVHWVEQLPFSSIDNIWLYQWEVAGFYIFLLLVLYYMMKRRLRYLWVCLSFLLMLGTGHSIMNWVNHPQRSLVFYNVRGCPVVHCIENDGHSWLSYGDQQSDKRRLQRVAANYWKQIQLLPPVEVKTDFQSAGFSRHRQILSYHGCRVGMITDNRWQNKSAVSPLSIQYLYLCKGYEGHMKELTRIFSPSCIVLDASFSESRKRLLEKECRQLGFRFISLSEEGSIRFLL